MARTLPAHRFPLLPLLAILLPVLWLTTPGIALAHARLLKTTPEAGARLDAPPTQLDLYLSEAVSLEFSTVKVYDRTRKEHAVGTIGRVAGQDTTVSVPVVETLPPGSYTVVWRVLSAVDGHLTSGSFSFRVRTPGGGPEPTEEPLSAEFETADAPFEGSGEQPGPFRWMLRALILGAAVLLMGGPMMNILVVEPSVSERGIAGEKLWPLVTRRSALIGAWAACALLLALALDLLAQVAAIGGSDLRWAMGRSDLALLVLNSTRYGFVWVL